MFIAFFFLIYLCGVGCIIPNYSDFFHERKTEKYFFENKSQKNSVDEFLTKKNGEGNSTFWVQTQYVDRTGKVSHQRTGIVSISRLDISQTRVLLLTDKENPKFTYEWKDFIQKQVLQPDETSFFLINAGYFLPDMHASGGLISKGEIQNPNRVYSSPSTGWILFEEKTHTLSLASRLPQDFSLVTWGFQSFPFIIQDYTKAVLPTEKYAQRTAVGVDKDGNFFIIITPFFLSLSDFADLLLASPYNFVNVLNLDGGASTLGMLFHKNTSTVFASSFERIPRVIIFIRK